MNAFLDWAQLQPNVWIVSSEQMLDWVRHPVPLSQLDSLASLKCSVPQVTSKICNGMLPNEMGLLAKCSFDDAYFSTCYGCPTAPPTPANPNPPQASGSGAPRLRIPANCSTPFWDPIAGSCTCTSGGCAFADTSRPIGPNGANLTGGGTGGTADPQPTSNPYQPFNGSTGLLGGTGQVWIAMLIGVVGAALGGYGTVSAAW